MDIHSIKTTDKVYNYTYQQYSDTKTIEIMISVLRHDRSQVIHDIRQWLNTHPLASTKELIYHLDAIKVVCTKMRIPDILKYRPCITDIAIKCMNADQHQRHTVERCKAILKQYKKYPFSPLK